MKIYGRNIFNQSIENSRKTYEIIKKLLLVKKMITQVIVYYMIPISKTIAR